MINSLSKITFERFAHDLTSGQPVYKLTVDLPNVQVAWRGRENVATLGQVVVSLSATQVQAIIELSQPVLEQRPAQLYESPQTLAGYERFKLEFDNGVCWQTTNHYGQYYASVAALRQSETWALAPAQDQAILRAWQRFGFGLDELLGVHPLVGNTAKPANASPDTTETALSLTENVLPQLTAEVANELFAKLQKRQQQLQSTRNVKQLWASLQGVLRLQNELQLNFSQPQKREEYVRWFQKMTQSFAQSNNPYEQIIAEDIHEARQFFSKTQPLNTSQICQILEYVLGKNHPEMVQGFMTILANNGYRLAQ